MILALLAQTPASQPQQPPALFQFLPLLVIFAIFYILFLRPRSNEQKKAKEMLSALKKGDRVVTIGGIVGTVVAVADREITLKVDESNNTKMTCVRWGIREVLSAEPPAK